jgi:hypothetical protein
VKTGETVIFEQEEYSDRSIVGVYVARVDLNLDDELAAHLAATPRSDEEDYCDKRYVTFPDALVAAGKLHEIRPLYAHLGSYGEKPKRSLEAK